MTTLKIVRKGQNTVIKAVQAIITSNGVTSKELMEKLHHPDLRPRVEDALKDFKLCLEEGDDVCVSRVIGQTCSRDQMDDFDISVSKLLDFLYTITIPAKEEKNLPVSNEEDSPDENETEFIQNLLNEVNSADEIFGMDFRILMEENGDLDMINGKMTSSLIRRLFKVYLEKYG